METDVEVSADGSLKLLSSLPEWLKPGRAHVLLSVPKEASPKPKRVIPTATPEMLAKRAEAFEAVRKLNPYRDEPVRKRRARMCTMKPESDRP